MNLKSVQKPGEIRGREMKEITFEQVAKALYGGVLSPFPQSERERITGRYMGRLLNDSGLTAEEAQREGSTVTVENIKETAFSVLDRDLEEKLLRLLEIDE